MDFSLEFKVMIGLALLSVGLTLLVVIRDSLVKDYRNIVYAEDCVHGTENHKLLPSYWSMFICVWVKFNSYIHTPSDEELTSTTPPAPKTERLSMLVWKYGEGKLTV